MRYFEYRFHFRRSSAIFVPYTKNNILCIHIYYSFQFSTAPFISWYIVPVTSESKSSSRYIGKAEA